MDPTRCAQHYTPSEVKTLLTESEGSSSAPNVNKTKVKTPLYGEIEVAVWSDDKTGGHAMERHLLITEGQLRERTLPGDDPTTEPGLPMASAFLADKLKDLCSVAHGLLNCKKGQTALSWLDAYAAFGKTRVCIVESITEMGLPAVDVRVFYQGRDKTRTEKAQQAAMVIDSNLGGKYPLKIVTVFPCKDDPRLELNLSGVLAECRNLHQAGPNALEGHAADLAKRAKVWASKQPSTIPDSVLVGNKILLGTRFNFGWLEPNAELYKFKYNAAGAPVKDADDPYDKKKYERDATAKPPAKLMSLVMLQAAAGMLGLKVGFSTSDPKKIVATV
jgi:hypothetical protein